jgi:hypothetical protein
MVVLTHRLKIRFSSMGDDPLSSASRSTPEDVSEAGGAGGGAARGGDHRRGGGEKVVIVVMDPEGKKINLKVSTDDDCESPAPAGVRVRVGEGGDKPLQEK